MAKRAPQPRQVTTSPARAPENGVLQSGQVRGVSTAGLPSGSPPLIFLRRGRAGQGGRPRGGLRMAVAPDARPAPGKAALGPGARRDAPQRHQAKPAPARQGRWPPAVLARAAAGGSEYAAAAAAVYFIRPC